MSNKSEFAPLASMEDISQVNTPLPTPGPSPRTKHRLGHSFFLKERIVFKLEVHGVFDFI